MRSAATCSRASSTARAPRSWSGFGPRLLGATIGAVLGVGSAYFGGQVDLYLQRLMDILLSFPLIILALAVVAILGNIASRT